jgi:hypothetical protein
MRCLGKTRFDVQGVLQVISGKKYHAKLSYSTTSVELPKLDQEVPEDWTKIEDDFTFLCINNMPFITIDDHIAPLSVIDDGYNDYIGQRGANGTRVKLTKY